MTTIPFSITNYIRSIGTEETNITYLYIDSYDNLVNWGGSPDRYGLLDMTPGLPVTEQVNFLEGLLPVSHIQVLLFLSIDEYHCAHVHIIPSETGTWVLLSDATSEHDQLQHLQQLINDLKLQVYQQNQLIQVLEQALEEEKCRYDLPLD